MAGSTPRHWSRRTRHVVARFALLAVAYLAGAGLAWAMTSLTTGSSTTVRAGTDRPIVVTNSGTTLYQEQPATVRVIITAVAVVLVLATGSVVWRVARRSTRLGVTGMAVAGLVGVAALLGMLTIGVFILPLAAVLALLALPIAPDRPAAVAASGYVPPGWYGDPVSNGSWRWWDGRSWTAHTAPPIS